MNESTDNLASSNGGKGAVRARREVLPSNFSKNDSRPLELSGDLLVNNPGSAVHSWELFAFGDDFGFGCAEFG